MARNPFEEIQRIIDDRVRRTPGLVSNLSGVVDDSVVVAPAVQQQGWWVLSAEMSKHPSFREFIDAYSFQRLPFAEVDAVEGQAYFPTAAALPPGHVTTFFATVRASGPATVPLEVQADGHTVSIYASDSLEATGSGTVRATLRFTEGTHFIAVVCSGSTRPIMVKTSPEIALLRQEITPAPPVLVGQPEVAYLRPDVGNYVVRVRWNNDAFASSWQVYRAEAVDRGWFENGVDQGSGRYTVRLHTDVLDLGIGELIFTSDFLGGTLRNFTAAGTDADDLLMYDLELQLDINAPVDPNAWEEARFFRSSNSYTSIGRVTYSGEQVLLYEDTAVEQNKIYLYRVTAFGFVTGTAESDFSAPGWVFADDLTPPGDITFDPLTDISLVNGELFLNYVAPPDADYAGVRVFLEDPLDGTRHIQLTTEYGLPSEPDQLSVRLPVAGRYWFRTFDTAGNIQPVGSGRMYEWDGSLNWARTVYGLLVATVDEGAGTCDLSLEVFGDEVLFPAEAEFFIDQLDTPLDLNGAGLTAHTFTAPGAISAVDYPALGDIPLATMGAKLFWVRLTDVDGAVTYAYTSADRGTLPGGAVVPEDYLSFPNLTCIYDEDVESIEITIPTTDSSGVLGTVTYTRAPGGGMQPTGGGYVIYDVGDPIVRRPDTTMTQELDLPVDGTRGRYIVVYKAGANSVVVWDGNLHGLPSKPPTLATRIVLDPTLKNAADVFVTVFTHTGEDVTLQMKDEDDPSLPIWQLVTDNSQATVRYEPNAVEIGPDAYFKRLDSAVWATKFNNVQLRTSQLKRLSVRAINKDSGVPSPWIMVPMPLVEVPIIEGVDLVFDEATDQLILRATGGEFCDSARFEIADNEAMSPVRATVDKAMSRGSLEFLSTNIASADRGKRWFGRVTPHNGPLTNTGTPTVTGLGGIAVLDAEFVPRLAGNAPVVTLDASLDASSNLVLKVTPVQFTQSIGHIVSSTAYDYSQAAQTIVDVGGLPLLTITLAPVPVGETRYVVVYPYESPGGGGGVGDPVIARVTNSPSQRVPLFGYILQTRDQAQSGIRVDFQIRVEDPDNRGGSLFAWVNQNGTASANPAAAADGVFGIPSTPFVVSNLNWSLLDNVLGNAQEDKVVYFEFVNSVGASTGKKDVKVTTRLIDLGPDGRLGPNTVTLTNFASGLKPVQVVSVLPATGSAGDLVFLTSNSKLYRWTGSGWTAAVPSTDITGQITGTQIADGSISTPKLVANSVTASILAAGSVTASAIAANAITAGAIQAGAVNATHLAANSVTATAIAAGAVTAGKVSIAQLSELSTNLGILVNGKLQSVDGQRYLDLNATGSSPFLYHPKLALYANGTAALSADLQLVTSTNGGQSASGVRYIYNTAIGPYAGNQEHYATLGGSVLDVFVAYPTVLDYSIRTVFLRMGEDAQGTPPAGANSTPFYVQSKRWFSPNVIRYEIYHLAAKHTMSLYSPDSTIEGIVWEGNAGGIYHGLWRWDIQGNPPYAYPNALTLSTTSTPGGTPILRYVFQPNGSALADVGWATFSPTPPKAAHAMTAEEWIAWAAEDARKPVKPYDGIPTESHAMVISEATRRGTKAADVAAEEVSKYGKDVAKIAIGTANWAYVLWEALRGAQSFQEFKQRLGL